MVVLSLYREWFRQSCLTVKEISSSTATDEVQSLIDLLSKQESILVIASRYHLHCMLHLQLTAIL